MYKGKQLTGEDGTVVEIKQKVQMQALPSQSRHRLRAELVQLGIALLIAFIGLLAGAREQIKKLDFLAAAIAIFLLGFGADAIKNALAPAQAPPEASTTPP